MMVQDDGFISIYEPTGAGRGGGAGAWGEGHRYDSSLFFKILSIHIESLSNIANSSETTKIKNLFVLYFLNTNDLKLEIEIEKIQFHIRPHFAKFDIQTGTEY